MSLRFKILLAALLPMAFALLIGAWLMNSWERVDRVRQDAATADAIRYEMGELAILVQEYLLHANPRVVRQLAKLHDRLKARLEAAGFQDADERALLEALRARHAHLDRLLPLLLEGKSGSREQIVGALLVKVHDARSKARQLTQLQHDKVVHIQREVDRRILFALAVLTLLSVTLLSLLGLRLLRGLAALRAGIRRIDAGDLDQAIPQHGDDELSDLARVFNDMARRLGDSYTSIDRLQHEIEERQRAEQALGGSERRFAAVFEQAAVGLALVAPDGGWLKVNRRLCTIVGYTPEELLVRTFQDITHPDDLEADLGYVRQMLAGEIDRYAMEKRYRRKDGSLVWINLTVALVWQQDGKTPDYFISVIEDISARKAAEESLRSSLERLSKVLNVDTVGVMFWDLGSSRLVDANDTFLTMMGYSRGDLETGELTWQKLTPPEYWDISRVEVEKFLATGRVGPYEKEYLRKDGTRQWFVFAGSAIGKNACVEFCVDVSARKAAEAELKRRNEELERFDRAATGRELRMISLKREVNALAQELGRAPPYDLSFAELGDEV